MNSRTLADWLMENGGPVIRYRTWHELLGSPSCDSPSKLLEDLQNSPFVQGWLARLVPETGFNQIHGAHPLAFENAAGKLTQLGLQCGNPDFDTRLQPFRNWLSAGITYASTHFWDPFLGMIVGGLLSAAGCRADRAVQDHLTRRLDILYDFTRQRNFAIYVDQADYPAIPRAFRTHALVNPNLTQDGIWRVPTIYDIHALAHHPTKDHDPAIRHQVNTVIDYILDSAYQALPWGYGIMYAGKDPQTGRRRYYAMGWSVHLPGYGKNPIAGSQPGGLVHRLVLLSRFPTAVHHPWFQKNLAHLETFRTPDGLYRFPKEYLPESQNGCWVLGAYMGLGENRRMRAALTIESTFWMALLQHNATAAQNQGI